MDTAIRMLASLVIAASASAAEYPFRGFAPTPPMGWNSWDNFGTSITEAQCKEQADAMAKYLKPAGYDIFTVDIQWYEPNSKGHDYKPGALLEMDDLSRLLPATTKFPSAANGVGFKKLADYVHAKGLRFGIHIMRGIPRQAVAKNTAISGTTARAADIANTRSTCPWNPDMFGVDMKKSGAQNYYDSLFQLYASWGVDFVKCDDISRAYDDGQLAEIEAIRKAIDKTGRKIVLSLSPGDTPIERGDHVMRNANMWRISDDFWDRWEPLRGMFGRLEKWTRYRTEGAWPDADMLPFGIVEFGRPTRFTKDEQILCMSLWCIARSPLIFGGDMTRMDPFTRDLLTNPEVLSVSRGSSNNRHVSTTDGRIVWTAEIPGSRDRYLALFNAKDDSFPYDLAKAAYRSPVIRGKEVAEISIPLNGAKKLALIVEDGGDNFNFDHASWVTPVLSGPKGKLKLTDLNWTSASAGHGEARKNLTHDGARIEGIGTHSRSLIEFEIPAGYDAFEAKGMLSSDRRSAEGSIAFVVCTDAAALPKSGTANVAVAFGDLGLTGEVAVRDLWARKNLGVFKETFSRDLPPHGAGLYRLIVR